MPQQISIRGISYIVEPEPHAKFWKQVAGNAWEPETFEIFDRFITDKTLFLDIGAWIGSTALYGAQRAKRCVAFEPDPVAFQELKRNVAANAGAAWAKNLEINECAVNKDGKSFSLGGSAEGATSMSSALYVQPESQWTVQATRLQDVLKKHRKARQPVFIKMDIEGGEYDLLPTIPDILADPLISLYVSCHPGILRLSVANAEDPDQEEAAFVQAHLALIDSLPWSRSISLTNGNAVDRAGLLRRVEKRGRFPREILISG